MSPPETSYFSYHIQLPREQKAAGKQGLQFRGQKSARISR
jgi:hypothetical protein